MTRAEMNGAEVCGTEDCKHIEVLAGDAQGSSQELVSQRLLSHLQAAKRELGLQQRIRFVRLRSLRDAERAVGSGRWTVGGNTLHADGPCACMRP